MEKPRRATEDYLKTIYLLGGSQLPVRCVDVANRLGVSRASVSVAVRRMCDEGYLASDAAHQVHLTQRGLAVAQDTLEKNHAIRALLRDFGVDEENADTEGTGRALKMRRVRGDRRPLAAAIRDRRRQSSKFLCRIARMARRLKTHIFRHEQTGWREECTAFSSKTARR